MERKISFQCQIHEKLLNFNFLQELNQADFFATEDI